MLNSLNYQNRFIIQGRSSRKAAWVDIDWDGRDEEDRDRLPNGDSLWDVLEEGNLTQLSACRMKVTNTGHLGDMLWSTAMRYAVVSDRFVEALAAADVTGYQVIAIPLQPKRGTPQSGYQLLLPDNRVREADIRSFPFLHRQSAQLDVSKELMATLERAAAIDFDVADAAGEVKDRWGPQAD